MSGCHKRVHSIIFNKTLQALFALSGAHTLNLYGIQAVESTEQVKTYFRKVQKLDNLFSSSPTCRKIFKKTVHYFIVYQTHHRVQELQQLKEK